MREEKRNRVRFLGIAGGVILFFLSLLLYFYGLFQLQQNLNNGAEAYLKIQELKPNFVLVQNEYTQLATKLEAENNIENLIPQINGVATALNIQISGLPEAPIRIQIPAASSVSVPFDKAKIDFQIQGISLKRMADFLNNIHKLPNKFSITKLEIVQVLGNKLYFNVLISLEAYVPKQAG